MKPAPWAMIIVVVSLSACSSTFLASKDGKGYHLGSSSDAAYRMFCLSGDLRIVLEDTQLPQELKGPSMPLSVRSNGPALRSGSSMGG